MRVLILVYLLTYLSTSLASSRLQGMHRIPLVRSKVTPTRCKSLLPDPINLQKEYTLHFDLLVTTLPSQTVNVVRFSNGGDIGDGGPAIYFNDGEKDRFRFYSIVDNKLENFYSRKKYSKNRWLHVSVEQRKENGHYYFIASIDGNDAHRVPLHYPSVRKNVRIYLSGCVYRPIDAFVRDMVLYNGVGCPDGCGNHGRCIGENKCQCGSGYDGKRCENDVSFHVRVGTPPWITDNEL